MCIRDRQSTKPITERQQYWLKHLNSAESSACSLVDYAREHALKSKDLYTWKKRLVDLGHLAGSERRTSRKFVPVVAASNAVATATLILPNGIRLKLPGGVNRALLQDLIDVVPQTV